MGLCAGFPYPGFMSPGPGFRLGRGMGFGRGRRWIGAGYGEYFNPPPLSYSVEDERALLESQAKEMGEILKQIESRLEELKQSSVRTGKK